MTLWTGIPFWMSPVVLQSKSQTSRSKSYHISTGPYQAIKSIAIHLKLKIISPITLINVILIMLHCMTHPLYTKVSHCSNQLITNTFPLPIHMCYLANSTSMFSTLHQQHCQVQLLIKLLGQFKLSHETALLHLKGCNGSQLITLFYYY